MKTLINFVPVTQPVTFETLDEDGKVMASYDCPVGQPQHFEIGSHGARILHGPEPKPAPEPEAVTPQG